MAWRAFYSYAHEDEALRDTLAKFLKPLVHQNKLQEWHDRRIEAGGNWEREISHELDSANLIFFLVSADFLASDYCLDVEMGRAMARAREGTARVIPVLLKPCLWQESPLSELQIIPRDAQPITLFPNPDAAFAAVAEEVNRVVSKAPPAAQGSAKARLPPASRDFVTSLDLVRDQVRSYARLYERTRLRMEPGDERTSRMEQVFQRMRGLAHAAYPLLDELSGSLLPGDRLAAVAILQVFAAVRYLPFLVGLVGSEKPFVGYHAIRALQFAVGALDPLRFPELRQALADAGEALRKANVGFLTDRQRVLNAAQRELEETIDALSVSVRR
jgi:hypothetical protein